MPHMETDDIEVEELLSEDDVPITHWGARIMAQANTLGKEKDNSVNVVSGPSQSTPVGAGDIHRGLKRTDFLRRQRIEERRRLVERVEAEAKMREDRMKAARQAREKQAQRDRADSLRPAEPTNDRMPFSNNKYQAAKPVIGWRRFMQSNPPNYAGILRWVVDCRLSDDPLLLGMPVADNEVNLSGKQPQFIISCFYTLYCLYQSIVINLRAA